MALFGGLFGHDKKAASVTGATPDGDPLQTLPMAPPSMGLSGNLNTGFAPSASAGVAAPPAAPQIQGDLNSGFTVPGAAQAPQLAQLPPAPPKKPGAFDDEHRRQTLLAMAAGFFGSQNFGDGLSKAAQAIYEGNAAADREGKVSYGGPDDAFEIATDPKTGKRTYTPVQEVVDYQNHKTSKLTPEKLLDLNGRYALALSQTDPAKRGEAATFMANNPTLYPGFNSALVGAGDNLGLSASTGQTVTQSGAAAARATAEDHREADRRFKHANADARLGLQADKTAASIADSHARVGLAEAAGGRAAQSNTRANLKAGIVGGYQYKMVNGKMMRRKVM